MLQLDGATLRAEREPDVACTASEPVHECCERYASGCVYRPVEVVTRVFFLRVADEGVVEQALQGPQADQIPSEALLQQGQVVVAP